MKLKNFHTLLLLTMLNVQADEGQWVEWIADFNASYSQFNNLNLSAFSDDAQDDQRLHVGGEFGRYYQFDGRSRMHLSAKAEASRFQDFDGMNNLSYGLGMGFRHKFGLGLFVPYIQANVAYSKQNYDTSAWDSDLFSTSLSLGKHWTDRLTLSTSVHWQKLDGKKGPTIEPALSAEPFDQHYWWAAVAADYVLAQDWLISADYSRRQGDFHSACTVGNVATVLTTMQVEAITLDDIFGGCVYRLNAKANIFSAQLSYAINAHTGINANVKYFDGSAGELDYHGSQLQLNYSYRY